MTTTQVQLNGLNEAQVRAVAAMLSERREDIPTYNHGGLSAPHWAPVVHLEGAGYTLFTPAVPVDVAADVVRVVEQLPA